MVEMNPASMPKANWNRPDSVTMKLNSYIFCYHFSIKLLKMQTGCAKMESRDIIFYPCSQQRLRAGDQKEVR